MLIPIVDQEMAQSAAKRCSQRNSRVQLDYHSVPPNLLDKSGYAYDKDQM